MKFIALGSNLPSNFGTPLDNLREAVRRLERHGLRVVARGGIYHSSPMYVTDQPSFVNSVIAVQSAMTAPDALAECLQVETSMGRVRTVKNGPRVIDIDLLDWDGETIHSPPLELPHPRIPERNFVLRPLLDIAPDWAHKISGLRGDAMLAALPDDLHLYQEQW